MDHLVGAVRSPAPPRQEAPVPHADTLAARHDVIRIPLGDGLHTLIDADDVLLVCEYRWARTRQGYARASHSPDGEKVNVLMHRLLMGCTPGDGFEVDHISLDRLDNRRSNLRVCTHAENDQNRPKARGSSQYRGVSHIPQKNRWRATAQIEGAQRYLGTYESETAAARAAEAARRQHMPFAIPRIDLEPVGSCVCVECRATAGHATRTRRAA